MGSLLSWTGKPQKLFTMKCRCKRLLMRRLGPRCTICVCPIAGGFGSPKRVGALGVPGGWVIRREKETGDFEPVKFPRETFRRDLQGFLSAKALHLTLKV